MMWPGRARDEHLSFLFKYVVKLEASIGIGCGICNQLAMLFVA